MRVVVRDRYPIQRPRDIVERIETIFIVAIILVNGNPPGGCSYFTADDAVLALHQIVVRVRQVRGKILFL